MVKGFHKKRIIQAIQKIVNCFTKSCSNIPLCAKDSLKVFCRYSKAKKTWKEMREKIGKSKGKEVGLKLVDSIKQCLQTPPPISMMSLEVKSKCSFPSLEDSIFLCCWASDLLLLMDPSSPESTASNKFLVNWFYGFRAFPFIVLILSCLRNFLISCFFGIVVAYPYYWTSEGFRIKDIILLLDYEMLKVFSFLKWRYCTTCISHIKNKIDGNLTL